MAKKIKNNEVMLVDGKDERETICKHPKDIRVLGWRPPFCEVHADVHFYSIRNHISILNFKRRPGRIQ